MTGYKLLSKPSPGITKLAFFGQNLFVGNVLDSTTVLSPDSTELKTLKVNFGSLDLLITKDGGIKSPCDSCLQW